MSLEECVQSPFDEGQGVVLIEETMFCFST